MSDIQDDGYTDAFSEQAQKSKTSNKNGEHDNTDSTHTLYYEIEVSSGHQDSNDEDDEYRKYLTTPEVKKFNTIVNSKVDVLSRVEMFDEKNKPENQDNDGRPGQKFPPPSENGRLDKVRTNHEHVAPESEEPFFTLGGATSSVHNLSAAYDKDKRDLSSAIMDHIPVGRIDAAPNTFASGHILPETSTPGKNSSHIQPETSTPPKASGHIRPEASAPWKASIPIYELAKPIKPVSKWTDTMKSTTSTITPSVNKSCIAGVGQAVPVDFINPPHISYRDDEKSTEYEKLYFKSVDSKFSESMREMLKKRGYGSLASINSELSSQRSDPQIQDQNSTLEYHADDDDLSFWGSEFDDVSLQYQDDASYVGGYFRDVSPNKPLPQTPGKKAFILRARSAPCDLSSSDDPSSTSCLPVIINPERHPPPHLPPQPSGLTQNQIKRRMIVESIINSERSYLESLERVIKDYEKTVLEFISQSKSSIKCVFAEMREIISHHKMFQIELSERVKRWDDDEKIGNIFTASFSKTMLVNAYSTFVNNFAASMEEIRVLQRSRQSFHDFLLKQEKLSHDRLSIFGLMVKPVQRFPQFIMFLQDLIKFTPQYHDDRRALQLALTELENVAYRLNERKRQSEQTFLANQTIQQLNKQKVQHVLNSWNLDLDSKRRLIRTDGVEQVQGEFENMRCKQRRLILMNDLVLCVKVIEKQQSGYTVEKLVLRWMTKLKDLELKDTVITPYMQSIVRREPEKIHIISSQPEKPEDDPFHLFADLHEMVHDHTVLAQITGLLTTLKRSYAGHGLREELVHEVTRDLQRMIQIKEEQLRLVNSCSIVLQDNSRTDKQQYVLQSQTAGIKQDWCMDFLMAKLALDRSNNMAWDGTISNDSCGFDVTPVHFMKHVPVDVPKNYTKIRCAVSIFLNPEKSTYGIGVQHLWVCSSNLTHGQVSVLSIHNSKPALMESFKACNSNILAVELIPGCGDIMKEENYLFPEDTVWVTTAHGEILIFPLASQDGMHRQPLAVLRTVAVTVSLKFVDERLFCGFDDGAISVYSRNADGSWNVSHPTLKSFGTSWVKFQFIHEENLWLSCANELFQLEIDSLETQNAFKLSTNHMSPIEQIVKSGVGIWVSFHGSSVIKLFHLETMENLQEISIGNFINRIRAEKLWTINGAIENLTVTCLTVSRGLLWVGTSLGIVLTVPLPRLSDGVPLYRGCPKISLHAHKGPVRFLFTMLCSSNILELNRASSLRSTLRARQSRRNLEREKMELEESQKRKERTINSESTKSLDAIGEMAISNDDQNNTIDTNLSTKEDEEMLCLDEGGSSVNIRDERGRTTTNKNENMFELDRKSKTISFRTDLAQRIMVKSRSLSRSNLDLTSLDSNEVEELYEILLEDETDAGEDDEDVTSASVRLDKRWSIGNTTPAVDLSVNPSPVKPSWLGKPPQNQTKLNDSQNLKSDVVLPFPEQVKNPPPIAASPSSSISSSAGDVSPTSSPIRGFLRGKGSRLTAIRKASCNAVIVLSGGDGYCDLDLSRNQSKMDDACVLLWVHKF